jgi:hypothetical protein
MSGLIRMQVITTLIVKPIQNFDKINYYLHLPSSRNIAIFRFSPSQTFYTLTIDSKKIKN